MQPILEKIGPHPWGNALLDDYELTIKMMVNGILVDYMTDTYVYQESLSSLKLLIRQRSRWAQGSLNCLKYLGQIIKTKRLSGGQKLGIYYFIAQPWLSFTADVTIIYLTATTIMKLTILIGDTDIQMIIGICLNLLVISLAIGVMFTILYCCDLTSFNEPMPKMKYLLRLPANVSYAYLWLFFSLIIAFWRWSRHQKSWLKKPAWK